MDAQKSVDCGALEFPPDIWAYIVCFLPGEQLGRLKITGATSLWRRLTHHRVVKSVKLGDDFLHFKTWPAFLNEFPSLEKLVIHSLDDTWWSDLGVRLDLLPSTLRKLQIKGCLGKSSNFFVGQDGGILQLAKYVPKIEELDLVDLIKIIDSYAWLKHSPASLTKLHIPCWMGDVPLPSSLIQFEANVVDVRNTATAISLPPGLESLSATNIFGLGKLGPKFPPSLLSIHFEYIKLGSQGFTVDNLPRSMTSIRMPLDSLTMPETVSRLPPNLTELRTLVSFMNQRDWQFLPASLTRLDCAVHDYITQSIVDPMNGNEVKVSMLPFEVLPRGLVTLILWSISNPPRMLFGPHRAESTASSYFPPLLTYLSIPSDEMSPELVAHLPSSLTYLELSKFCERVCKHLPGGLLTLIARRTIFSPNLIKLLPRSLTSLELTLHSNYEPNIVWEDNCLVPPNLTCLKLVDFNDLKDPFLKQKLPNLLSLHLAQSMLVSDQSISFLSRHLSLLNLSSSSSITGKCFPDLPRSLTWLNLNSSSSIADSDIQHLPRALLELYLDSATSLTDLCVPDLPRHLKKLSLRANEKISLSSIPCMPYPLRSIQTADRDAIRLREWSASGKTRPAFQP